MSYMKRLLETLEPVSKDSFMHEILWNACPESEHYNPIFEVDVKTYRITLHCATFLVKCIYDNETETFTITNYEKKELN